MKTIFKTVLNLLFLYLKSDFQIEVYAYQHQHRDDDFHVFSQSVLEDIAVELALNRSLPSSKLEPNRDVLVLC